MQPNTRFKAIPPLVGRFPDARLLGLLEQVSTAKQLAGTWKITSFSLQQLPAGARHNLTQVLLAGDGTFVARDLPGFAHPLGDAPDSGSGTWNVELPDSSEQPQRLILLFQDGTLHDFGGELFVQSPQELYYSLGDPDEWNRVSFERQP